MATNREAKLTHEERHPRVLFTVDATVSFEEGEMDHEWLFEVTIMEDDPVRDDRLKRERYYFTPNQRETELVRQVDMGWAQVDTEPGREEVYADLWLAPIGGPPNTSEDRKRTNTVSVDV